jgi:hypothetical protein
MRAQSVSTAAGCVALTENARTVGEGVSDRGAELPEDLTQILFEVLIDLDVLVVSKVFMW